MVGVYGIPSEIVENIFALETVDWEWFGKIRSKTFKKVFGREDFQGLFLNGLTDAPEEEAIRVRHAPSAYRVRKRENVSKYREKRLVPDDKNIFNDKNESFLAIKNNLSTKTFPGRR